MRSAKSPSLVLLLLALLAGANSARAQSGRRVPSTVPQPPSTETPVKNQNNTDVNSETAAETSRSRIKLLIGRRPTSRHLESEDAIYEEFVNWLNGQKNIEATSIGDLRKRSEAVRRARAETDPFVVMLQLEIDSFQKGAIVLNSPDLRIKCLVFAPRTGKQKYKATVYFQAIGGARARRDAWPNGPPIKITPEGAAVAAAERLYDWLRLIIEAKQR